MTTPVRAVPRESDEWAAVAVSTAAGVAVPSGAVQFAVLPRDTRPVDTDWKPAVDDPDGSTAYGVDVGPVSGEETDGVWVAVATTGGRTVVLEPEDVGYIMRT